MGTRIPVIFTAAALVAVAGCSVGTTSDDGQDGQPSPQEDIGQVAQAEANTVAYVVTCSYGVLYANYGGGPLDPYYGGAPLPVAKRLGLKLGSGNANWGVVLNYGTSDWGYFLRSCMQAE